MCHDGCFKKHYYPVNPNPVEMTQQTMVTVPDGILGLGQQAQENGVLIL